MEWTRQSVISLICTVRRTAWRKRRNGQKRSPEYRQTPSEVWQGVMPWQSRLPSFRDTDRSAMLMENRAPGAAFCLPV